MAHLAMQFGPGQGFSCHICQLIIFMDDFIKTLFRPQNLTNCFTIVISNDACTAAKSSGVSALVKTTNQDKGVTNFG